MQTDAKLPYCLPRAFCISALFWVRLTVESQKAKVNRYVRIKVQGSAVVQGEMPLLKPSS